MPLIKVVPKNVPLRPSAVDQLAGPGPGASSSSPWSAIRSSRRWARPIRQTWSGSRAARLARRAAPLGFVRCAVRAFYL